MPRPRALVLLGLALLIAPPALAHDVRYDVHKEGSALAVRLFYAGGGPFSFASYEIYHEGEEIPFHAGRTDAQGRIVFLPDRAGAWRVRAFSEDGHGIDFELITDATGQVTAGDRPASDRRLRITTGVVLILALFGVARVLAKRKA